ncbi:MAG: hypothetical protein RRY38_01030 [Oscillospiraceae bacterium]
MEIKLLLCDTKFSGGLGKQEDQSCRHCVMRAQFDLKETQSLSGGFEFLLVFAKCSLTAE